MSEHNTKKLADARMHPDEIKAEQKDAAKKLEMIVKIMNRIKATCIVRRIDDLGRIVIPKEIRRTLRIRMGDPSLKTLTQDLAFCMGLESAKERYIMK